MSFGCSYCPYPIGQGLKWRFRSPKNVVDEMEHLVRTFRVEHILFRDPMFSMQKKRVVAICGEIVRRGLRVTWKCETRMDCLDDETLASMARAGCVGVNFGVESIDPEVQKGVHRKPILVDEFRTKVALCRKYSISTFAFSLLAFPAIRSRRFSIRWSSRFTCGRAGRNSRWRRHSSERRCTTGQSSSGSSRRTSTRSSMRTPSPTETKRCAAATSSACIALRIPQGLLNRRGILKNDRRNDLVYHVAKMTADVVTHSVADGRQGGKALLRAACQTDATARCATAQSKNSAILRPSRLSALVCDWCELGSLAIALVALAAVGFAVLARRLPSGGYAVTEAHSRGAT